MIINSQCTQLASFLVKGNISYMLSLGGRLVRWQKGVRAVGFNLSSPMGLYLDLSVWLYALKWRAVGKRKKIKITCYSECSTCSTQYWSKDVGCILLVKKSVSFSWKCTSDSWMLPFDIIIADLYVLRKSVPPNKEPFYTGSCKACLTL